MGSRKVIVKQTAADNIAAIAWYIESKGMIATAEKFADNVYDYFIKLADTRRLMPFVENDNEPCLVSNVFHIKKAIQLSLLKLNSK